MNNCPAGARMFLNKKEDLNSGKHSLDFFSTGLPLSDFLFYQKLSTLTPPPPHPKNIHSPSQSGGKNFLKKKKAPKRGKALIYFFLKGPPLPPFLF